MRYRKPSLKTLLGVTKAKRRLKRELGIYEITKHTNALKNAKRRVKRKAGLSSEPAKLVRFLARLLR